MLKFSLVGHIQLLIALVTCILASYSLSGILAGARRLELDAEAAGH